VTSQAGELEARAEALRAARTPFVSATVVQAERPTSAKPGDAALVLADGTVLGFVGGECAATSVQVEALAALARDEPVLLRITPSPAPEEAAARPGTVTVHNPCLSGGTLEIFLEPAVPPPLVVVHGEAPIARAFADVARAAGYAVEAWSGAGMPADTTAVVVASHGRDEAPVLIAALHAGVPYVGLVASPRRGRGVLEALGADGGRVHTPAGFDIGARTPGEVAVSVLAEIVSVRPRRASAVPAPEHGAATAATAVDPVCGMTVACAPASLSLELDGATWWFCGSGCRDAFVADPGAFGHR
jgi:xanthine dehydrogenase accessory factor